MNNTNGTLDTRLSQDLTKTFEIPCNKEYDRFSPFKLAGGNGIWLVHCPSGVKAYFATENAFDKKVPINQENRGMRFAEIGSEGITKLFDNFYIYTEGTSADDKLIITVSSQESAVEPILGNASGNIAVLDEVGGFSTNAINDLSRAMLGGVCPKCKIKFQKQILITGGYEFAPTHNAQGMKLYHFPLGKDFRIKDLNLKDDTLYRIRQVGHFDIGQARRDTDGTQLWEYKISDPINFSYSKSATYQSVKPCKPHGTNPCMSVSGGVTISFNDELNKIIFTNKGNINIDNTYLINGKVANKDNIILDETIEKDLKFTTKTSTNEVYTNMNNSFYHYNIDVTRIAHDFATGKIDTYGAYSRCVTCYPIDGNRGYVSGNITAFVNLSNLVFIKDIVLKSAATTTTTFFSIYQSAHLSLIKEIETPGYVAAPTGIERSFSNLYTSLSLPYYQKFDLWGQKVRHSNKDNIINNYEGTGINANAFDLVVSGAILNQYDNFMMGWNVTNLYNPDLKLTASAADCHSSIILEITEL